MSARTEVRIRYRNFDEPQPFEYIGYGDVKELAPAVLLRHLAALDRDPNVRWAWVETREVSEWKVSGGSELLLYGTDRRKALMTIAAYLDPETFERYRELRKAGRIDVLATNSDGDTIHGVSVNGAAPHAMTTAELVELINSMTTEEEVIEEEAQPDP